MTLTQEEKQILLADLCARLPYGVMVKYRNRNTPVKCDLDCHPNIDDLENTKPYLRPMSSMTIDELDDCVMNSGLRDIPCPSYKGSEDEIEKQRLEHSIKVFKTDAYCTDWLDAHHFDCRGLIPMGLALEALEGMYKIKVKGINLNSNKI